LSLAPLAGPREGAARAQAVFCELALVALAVLGWDYYRFFLEKRGVGFALRVFPLHVLYHLYNGISFAVGTTLFVAARRFGLSLPGALPAFAKSTKREPRRGAEHPDSRVVATPDV